MLEILRTEDGEIRACCEYYIVDEKGNFQKDGKFVWINELAVAPKYEKTGCLREFIKIITDKVPWADFGYFWRQYKYPNRPPRIYTRKQWLKLLK